MRRIKEQHIENGKNDIKKNLIHFRIKSKEKKNESFVAILNWHYKMTANKDSPEEYPHKRSVLIETKERC